jgi:hypothetical protein
MPLEIAKGLQTTTKWVRQRSIVGDFRGARDALYGALLSYSLAQDLSWRRLEVLEKAGNGTEDLLARGGGF